MKAITLLLFLALGVGIATAQKRKCVPNTTPPRDNAVRLRLTTTIAETRYSIEDGSKFLYIKLNLNYLNIGTRSILLDKKSSLIYRRVVSKSLRAASTCKYLGDVSAHFIGAESMQAKDPERSEFVMLKPGESVSFKGEIGLRLFNGTKGTHDDLHPGTYVLQVRVAAWSYYADPAEWEQKWGGEAYLWSENVTSEPMAFTVEKR